MNFNYKVKIGGIITSLGLFLKGHVNSVWASWIGDGLILIGPIAAAWFTKDKDMTGGNREQ